MFALIPSALALDFVSTGRPAVLYDGPSVAAEKIVIVGTGYPLEKIVSTEGWVKVRDETGRLSWIEQGALSSKRTALVQATVVAVLEQPADHALVRYRAARGVILEIVSAEANGWLRVRHASGEEGYLRARDLWGT
jgi:SH3-like domain-containing protein